MFQTILLRSLSMHLFFIILVLAVSQAKVKAQERQGCFVIFSSGEIVNLDNLCIRRNQPMSLSDRARYERGMNFAGRGNYSQAMFEFNQAISLNPDYAEAYVGRGLVFKLQGNYQAFREEYQQAISVYQRQGNFEQAANIQAALGNP